MSKLDKQQTAAAAAAASATLHAASIAVVNMGQEKWSSDLCSCLDDCGVCMFTCICPCIQFGQNTSTLEAGSGACCGKQCCLPSLCWCLMSSFGLCCLLQAPSRKAIRKKYGILDESDCLITMCCSVCAICQEAREIKKQGTRY